MPLHNEKRNFIRMQVQTIATLVINHSSYVFICQDLSANGARLVGPTESTLKEGDEGKIVINSGGGFSAPLEATVKICRICRDGNQEEVALEMLEVH